LIRATALGTAKAKSPSFSTDDEFFGT